MPKSDSRLNLAQQHDKKAESHLRKAIELEQAASNTTTLAARERYYETARKERDAAMTSLKDATIAFGPSIEELREDVDPLD